MRLTTHKQIPEAPMSDTRHLADLEFDDWPLSRNLESQISGHVSAGPQTEIIMLQKADVWLSQLKARLNLSIIALVVMWGAVSYFKSTSLQLLAHSAPEAEKFLADGSADDASIPTMDGHSLKGNMEEIPVPTVETVKTVKADPALPEVAPKVKAAPVAVKKAAAPKASVNKRSARNQKKLKKSLASKSAP
jgi:hypothetical protein